jgi:hypothetical protein
LFFIIFSFADSSSFLCSLTLRAEADSRVMVIRRWTGGREVRIKCFIHCLFLFKYDSPFFSNIFQKGGNKWLASARGGDELGIQAKQRKSAGGRTGQGEVNDK